MRGAFRTSTGRESLRKYVRSFGDVVYTFSQVVCPFRCCVPIRHFGWQRRSFPPKTLCETGCTHRRIGWSLRTATNFITTRRDSLRVVDLLQSWEGRPEIDLSTTRSLPGRHVDLCPIERAPSAMNHWAFGAGYELKHFLICSLQTPLRCAAVAESVQASTAQNGYCGSRSHVYSEPMRIKPYLKSLFPWGNTASRLHVCRSRTGLSARRDRV